MRTACMAAAEAPVTLTTGTDANTITLNTALLPSQPGWMFEPSGVRGSLDEPRRRPGRGHLREMDADGALFRTGTLASSAEDRTEIGAGAHPV